MPNFCGKPLMIVVAFVAAAGCAGADEEDAATFTADQFADRLTDVIHSIAESYIHEMDAGELCRWAVNGLERKAGKAIPPGIAARLAKIHDPSLPEMRRLLTDIAADAGGDLRSLADFAVKQLLGRLDGRTQLIEQDQTMNGGRVPLSTGIGVRLASDPATGMIRIQYPFLHGPAHRAGLKAGDVITEIAYPKNEMPDGPPPGVDVFPTKDMSLDSAYWHLSGTIGKAVYLDVRRPGADKVLRFTVPRAQNVPESVFGVRRHNDDRWDHWLDGNRKIGYMRLATIRENTQKVMANEIAALRMQGMKALVLDLRGNASGLVYDGASIAEMFVGEAPLFTIRVRGEDDRFQGTPAKAHRDFPMACLVNADTVGLAEVLAACLQDNQRAAIVGERTPGYASIEHYSFHGNDFYLRITAGVYLRPNGKKLDRIHPTGLRSDEWGVTPDKGYELVVSPKERDELREHFEKQFEIRPPGRANEHRPVFKDRPLELAREYLRRRTQ